MRKSGNRTLRDSWVLGVPGLVRLADIDGLRSGDRRLGRSQRDGQCSLGETGGGAGCELVDRVRGCVSLRMSYRKQAYPARSQVGAKAAHLLISI